MSVCGILYHSPIKSQQVPFTPWSGILFPRYQAVYTTLDLESGTFGYLIANPGIDRSNIGVLDSDCFMKGPALLNFKL